MSRKMLFALAGVAVLLAGSPAWKRERIEGCPLYPQKQTCLSSA
jgi:hypothetical protein